METITRIVRTSLRSFESNSSVVWISNMSLKKSLSGDYGMFVEPNGMCCVGTRNPWTSGDQKYYTPIEYALPPVVR